MKKNTKLVAYTLSVVLLIAAVAGGCSYMSPDSEPAPTPEYPPQQPTSEPTQTPNPSTAAYSETSPELAEKMKAGEQDADVLVSCAWSLIREAVEAYTNTSSETLGSEAPFFTDAEITRLERAYSTDDGFVNGGKAEVWLLEYRIKPANIQSVMLAGGANTDADNWITSAGSMGHPCPVVLELDGSREVLCCLSGGEGTEFQYLLWDELDSLGIPYNDPVVPEDLLYEWQREYFALYERISSQWDIRGLGVLEMTGDSIPELLVYDPGAGVNGGMSIYTYEDGELKAFNLANSFGLPAARNAVDSAFSANPASDVLDDEYDVAYLRYYTEQTEGDTVGFYMLNAGNAAWPGETWCDWIRFGVDEDGCLLCETLLSLSLTGEYDDSNAYRETSWSLNGVNVPQEEYRQAESEFSLWRDSLTHIRWNWGDYTVDRGQSDNAALRRAFLRLLDYSARIR